MLSALLVRIINFICLSRRCYLCVTSALFVRDVCAINLSHLRYLLVSSVYFFGLVCVICSCHMCYLYVSSAIFCLTESGTRIAVITFTDTANIVFNLDDPNVRSKEAVKAKINAITVR